MRSLVKRWEKKLNKYREQNAWGIGGCQGIGEETETVEFIQGPHWAAGLTADGDKQG